MSDSISTLPNPLSEDLIGIHDQVAGEFQGLEEQAAVISDKVIECEERHSTIDSLTTVIDSTLAAYGETGMTAEQVKAYEVSIECVLQASGISMPAGLFVPSFESSAAGTYSTEARAKATEIISKMLAWLYTMLKHIQDAVSTFMTQLMTNGKSIESYAMRVKDKVEHVSNVKEPKGEVNVGRYADLLTDRFDRIAKPEHHIVQTVAIYEEFIAAWHQRWAPLTTFNVPSSMTTGKEVAIVGGNLHDLAIKAIRENDSKGGFPFCVSHSIELTPGKGDIPLLGAKVRIVQTTKAKTTIAPILTKQEMLTGIDVIMHSIVELRKIERETKALAVVTSRVERLSKGVNMREGEDGGAEAMKNLREAVRAMGKASTLATWGYVNTALYFLRVVKAGVHYIELSAAKY